MTIDRDDNNIKKDKNHRITINYVVTLSMNMGYPSTHQFIEAYVFGTHYYFIIFKID